MMKAWILSAALLLASSAWAQEVLVGRVYSVSSGDNWVQLSGGCVVLVPWSAELSAGGQRIDLGDLQPGALVRIALDDDGQAERLELLPEPPGPVVHACTPGVVRP